MGNCRRSTNNSRKSVILQELSYRKQIARQQRTQYAEGIYKHKYYTVTLKYRLRVTQGVKVTGNGTIGYIIHGLVVIELFDVDYYRDLEIWVRGH